MARILVVDDDKNLLRVTADYLKSRGHKVATCDQPEREGAAAEADEPQLLILDYQMPGVSGPQVLTELRRDAARADVPVIFLSGLEAMDYASQVPPDPKIRFLRKPADFESLDALIAELLPGIWPNP